MVALALLVQCAVLLAAVVFVSVVWARNARTGVRQRVLANLTDGSAVEGVLWQRRGRLLILRDAVIHERGAQPVSADGEVLLDRDRVLFVQARYGGGA